MKGYPIEHAKKPCNLNYYHQKDTKFLKLIAILINTYHKFSL